MSRRAWAAVEVRSRVRGLEVETLRRWLRDLPPSVGYVVSVKPLRYRTSPHLGGFCWYEDRLIELQLPEPFKPWSEGVYYKAQRRPGSRMRFKWFSRQVRFTTRRDVVRFLYCHEFYHWYLKVVLGRKAAAETACDRFALKHFRAHHRSTVWKEELPGYPSEGPKQLKRSA
jgi:hypothetical protein